MDEVVVDLTLNSDIDSINSDSDVEVLETKTCKKSDKFVSFDDMDKR